MTALYEFVLVARGITSPREAVHEAIDDSDGDALANITWSMHNGEIVIDFAVESDSYEHAVELARAELHHVAPEAEVVEVRRGPTTPSADTAPAVRPQVDEPIDAVLAQYSVTQHRWFRHAEAPQLGGATPYEALRAGERDAVLALARGGRSDGDPPLLSRERGAAILEQTAGQTPPYEL